VSPRRLVASGLIVGLAAATGALPAPVRGQQPNPFQRVRIDAIAVDGRGAAVRALGPADFEVREGGSVVALEEARFVEDNARAIGIYLDEYHITAGPNADRLRTALTGFIEREVGPDDVVVVLKPLDSLLAIEPAADRDAARRIIASLEGRKGNYAPRTDYERGYMSGAAERIEAARTQIAVSALNALAVRLGALNDRRKTLIVVAEGLDEALPRRRGQEYLATLDSVVRSANRGNVSIYPLDPRPTSAAALDRGGSDLDSLESLADGTEGRIVATSSEDEDLAAPLRTVMADARAYYMLSYTHAREQNGAFHPVEVRVKRAGIRVRARSGYWTPSASDRLGAELVAAANRPPAPVRVEPMRYNSPLIRPWFGLSVSDEGKMRVTFVWEPSRGVPGTPTSITAARLELTVLDDDDAVVFQGPVLPTGPVISTDAGPARAVFETEPGRLRLRMKIEDASRRQVDSDVRDLEVRDVRGRVSIGTPEFLRARNAREFRTIHENPQAVPVSSREFSRTERLLIRFRVHDPGDAALSVGARLLNFAGQPMRTLEAREAAGGTYEVDVALAGLVSGDYFLELTAGGTAGQTTERVAFRVVS
jgi:VWFA-related protein